MTTAVADPGILGDLSEDVLQCLRQTLLHCRATFSFYRERFDSAGIRADDLLTSDPLEILGRLPPLEAGGHERLADESLAAVGGIVDIETSSGTSSATPKRRFISERDAALEEDLLVRSFEICGIGPGDRVACLDVDPLAVMASFLGGLERLGVQEAYAYAVGPDVDRSLTGLRRLDPTVIISTPSIIERCLPSLAGRSGGGGGGSLGKVVYVGERLPARTRSEMESHAGIEVFGYYGAAETSVMGVECTAHDGVHLFTDHNLFELQPPHDGAAGEVLVTSLKLRTTPLLRYALGDVLAARPGTCLCGLDSPRVEVLERKGDSFTVLGARLSYGGLHEAVYNREAGPMRLVLTREARDRLTIVLPGEMDEDAAALRDAVLDAQPEVEFLVRGGYMDLGLSFVDMDLPPGGSKLRRVIDLRGADAD